MYNVVTVSPSLPTFMVGKHETDKLNSALNSQEKPDAHFWPLGANMIINKQ